MDFDVAPHSPVPRRTIDVSGLPTVGMDWRAPLWWGNLLMIFIETTTVILLLTSYYYVRRNYNVWPPPRPDIPGPDVDPFPGLTAATINTAVLVLSCVPMYLTNLFARAKRRRATLAGLTLMLVLSGACLWIRFYEFPAVKFSWADNAYASIVWITLGLHLIYIAGGIGEFFIMTLWLIGHDIDDKHALDVTLAGGYWYWVAGIWVPIYVTIYFAPRFL